MAHTSDSSHLSDTAKYAARRMGAGAILASALLVFPMCWPMLGPILGTSHAVDVPAERVGVSFAAAGQPATASQQKQTAPAAKMAKTKEPQKSAAATPENAQPTPAQMTTEDLDAFFNGLVPLQIERDDIAGAVVAVVKDGKVIFAKGYGYADLKNKKPVSAEGTLFRVGSISKLFTWTAVMQLVQDGKINLDADINQYLDFKTPDTFHKPITMRNLMTHTPGFDETIKDLITTNAANIPSLGDYLKSHEPIQIFPPGTVGAYSNYGATLAGYIVQRVSGEDFYEYIEHHIFEPLGMTHATFRQPLPANLRPMMSQGFQAASGGAKPFEIVTAAPAGSVAVTAMDITHFMLAQLNNGTYMVPVSGINVQMRCPHGLSGCSVPDQPVQILKPETVKLMHTRQYAPDPKVNGMCLGFYEESRNGHRIIGHGGDTVYFHSDLHLIQDANVGLFVSYNSAGRGDVEPRGPLFAQFMDRYFPYTPPQTPPVSTAAHDAAAVGGTYIASRRPQDNIFYLFAILGEAKVAPGKDGTLVIAGQKGINGAPIEWHEKEQNVWYDPADPQDLMVFRQDNGRWNIALEFPATVLQQVGWFQSVGFVQNGLIFALGLFALTLLLWPVGAFIRWHYGRKLTLSDAERRTRKWTHIVCILDLLFWALFLGTIVEGGSHLSVLSSAMDPWFRVIQIIGWIGVIATVIAILKYFFSGRIAGRWWWAKVHGVLFVLACLMSLWLIWFTHLLSFSLNY